MTDDAERLIEALAEFGRTGIGQFGWFHMVAGSDLLERLAHTEGTNVAAAVEPVWNIVRTADYLSFLDGRAMRILGGGSIGEVFRNAGWQIVKIAVDSRETPANALPFDVPGLMRIEPDSALSTYEYQFHVEKGGIRHLYATIAEFYHPKYRSLPDLPELAPES